MASYTYWPKVKADSNLDVTSFSRRPSGQVTLSMHQMVMLVLELEEK